jgi:hypothetical protein
MPESTPLLSSYGAILLILSVSNVGGGERYDRGLWHCVQLHVRLLQLTGHVGQRKFEQRVLERLACMSCFETRYALLHQLTSTHTSNAL